MRRGAAAKPRSEAARKRSAKARGEGKRRRLRSFLHRTLHDAFRRRSNNCHAVATTRVFPISMGKSQKKGSCGAFLRCDRILLSRQRQDTFKRTARRRRVVEGVGNVTINLHLSIYYDIPAASTHHLPQPLLSHFGASGGSILSLCLVKEKEWTKKEKPLGFRYGERRTAVCALLRILSLLTQQLFSLWIFSHLRRASRLSFRLPLTNGMGGDFFFCRKGHFLIEHPLSPKNAFAQRETWICIVTR